MQNTQVQERKGNILGWEKIGKLLLKFSVPGIIAMVVNSLYNMVDQIFIGHGVGELGNGATVVLFPMTIICLAMFLMVSDGTASYMSLMLGRKDEKEAASGVSAGIVASIFIGITLCTVFLIFLKPICLLFGATELIMPYAMDYGLIVVLGVPFFAVAVGFAGLIRADGSPAYNMLGLVVGCVTNIVLDWLFIMVFHWGVKGAALATIIGQFINAVLYFIYVFKMKTVKLSKESFKNCFHSLPEILKLGLSSFMNQAVLVVLLVAQNNVLKIYGKNSIYGEETPMTALGVTMKLFNMVTAVVIGLSAGAQPIIGYNYGSGNMERVKKTFFYTNIIAFLTMTFAFLLFQIFPNQIISIFGKTDELYVEFSVKCLRIHLMALPLMAIKFVSTSFLQAIGCPVWAAILSLSRQIIFQLPFLFILPIFMSVDGVLWAGPIADVLTFILAFGVLFFNRKKYFGVHEKKESQYEKQSEREEEQFNSNVEKTASNTVSEVLSCDNLKTNTFKNTIEEKLNGQNFAISIGRSYGAGGRSIAKEIAKKLSISYLDKSILKKAANESGLSEKLIAESDEVVDKKHFSHNFELTAWQNTEGADYYKEAELAKNNVMIKEASKGPCVVVGRRGDVVLKPLMPVYSVFVTASENMRAERVSKRENITFEDALNKIERIDKERASYYNRNGKELWGKEENYELIIDSTSLDADKASDIIINSFINSLNS